ncbi:MAG: Rho termination factor N-terminal domain-containing protein [Candidatus Lokiarchaeota archaeon]|nr:Rho termination factor N-terminal domain-containing protein [Candidatus Lokiarchaeota archaeon]
MEKKQYYELNEDDDKIIFLEVDETDDMVSNEMIFNNKLKYQKKLCIGLLPEEIQHKINRYIVNSTIEKIKPHFEKRLNYWNEKYSLEATMRAFEEHKKKWHNNPNYINFEQYMRDSLNRMLEYYRMDEIKYYNDELYHYERDYKEDILSEEYVPFSNAGKIYEIKKWRNIKGNDAIILERDYKNGGIEILNLLSSYSGGIHRTRDEKVYKKTTIKQLKEYCKMNGIKNYSKLKKDELINKLMKV